MDNREYKNIITDCTYAVRAEMSGRHHTGLHELTVSCCVNGSMITGYKKIGVSTPTKSDIQSCIMQRVYKEISNIKYRRV